MSVKVKFQVNRIESILMSRQIDVNDEYSQENTELIELKTVYLNATYGDGNPQSTDSKYWRDNPNGNLEISLTNQADWDQFKLGGYYMIEIKEAPPVVEVKPTAPERP